MGRALRELRRHARVYGALLAQAVRRDAQFPAQAWTIAVVALAELVIGLVPVLVVSSSIETVAGMQGWTPALMITVAGCFQVAMSLLNTFVDPNATRISDYVQRGELDAVLLRPVDAQWFSAVRWLRPAALSGAAGGLLVIMIGLRDTTLGVWPVLAAIGWFGCGLLLVGLLWLNLAYLAFWLQAAAFIHDLVRALLGLGRYPAPVFDHVVRAGMIFVVPIGVATTLPVQALTTGVPLPVGAAVATLTVAALLATRLHWRLALRRYASASS